MKICKLNFTKRVNKILKNTIQCRKSFIILLFISEFLMIGISAYFVCFFVCFDIMLETRQSKFKDKPDTEEFPYHKINRF